MSRTAREVMELYNLIVWNTRDFALADELMGDSVIRHDVGEAHTTTISSMEIFRVIDGRFIEVWNCGYKQGVWQ
jgi:hypothetical protein